ncbi:MAG: hypothetical protein FIA94_02505 [Nitrospirae bacterium]|nr:hypothetical protein [Nitrospirota bacterium]
MRKKTDLLWTWLIPDAERTPDRSSWIRHGGKWIIFDSMKKVIELAERLSPFLESGEVEGAKYWNKDPSALCVYSLDRDRERVGAILDGLGAGRDRVWEYDYAWDKNIQSPLTFLYSWFSKLTTILRSYGIAGTLRLIAEILRPR